MSPTPRAHSPLYLYMTHSHDHLRTLLARLLAAMEAGARADVLGLWTQLDHDLLSHMEAEERFILPAFAHVDMTEARDLVREHGLIREELLELGVAVELHCVRCESGDAFADLLVRHAAREEQLMYRWADQRLSPQAALDVTKHLSVP
ncbi:MAG TPA: hemerythrin domain-containing protein [Kofleriaceae bacterium]|jgi:hemerythrin-like domain-containing protein